jgi:hypothetical protein
MKQLAVILTLLLIVVLLLAVKVVSPHRRPKSECAGQVLMLKGPHGEPVECVCQSGVLSACFHPGP